MASDKDYIQQEVDKNPDLALEVEAKLGEVLGNPGNVTALTAAITATATTYAANIPQGTNNVSLPIKIFTSKSNVLLSITINLSSGEDPAKAIAMAIASQAAASMVAAAGAAAAGAAAPFLIAVGATAVGYFVCPAELANPACCKIQASP